MSGTHNNPANGAGGGTLNTAFASSASLPDKPPPAKSAKPATSIVSLLVTADERAVLERNAAGLAMSEYLRVRLLGDDVEPRRTRGKFPVKDYEAMAKVLGQLGRSGLPAHVAALAWAVENGSMSIGPDFEAAVQQACTDISDMRDDLIKALGLRSAGSP